MVDIKEVAEDIYMIDDQLYSIPAWGSVYLIDEEKKALIDSGPTTSAEAVLDGIKEIGVKFKDIDYIIVTHIHLDHAGGAGVLIKEMPRAQVVVHHKGARHLVDPVKLVSSATEVQGEEGMAKHGEVMPIETHRVKPVYDDDILKLSERQVLRFIDAQGHAPHELCVHEGRNNGVFTGDAAGISVAGNTISLPASQLPSFDFEMCLKTLKRLMKLNATMIYFAHFGVSNKVQASLQSAIDKLQAWNDIVAQSVKEGSLDDAGERIMAKVRTELEPVRKMEVLYEYLTEHDQPTSVDGFIRYYQEKHRVLLNVEG